MGYHVERVPFLALGLGRNGDVSDYEPLLFRGQLRATDRTLHIHRHRRASTSASASEEQTTNGSATTARANSSDRVERGRGGASKSERLPPSNPKPGLLDSFTYLSLLIYIYIPQRAFKIHQNKRFFCLRLHKTPELTMISSPQSFPTRTSILGKT